jgi:hypothetical protein
MSRGCSRSTVAAAGEGEMKSRQVRSGNMDGAATSGFLRQDDANRNRFDLGRLDERVYLRILTRSSAECLL